MQNNIFAKTRGFLQTQLQAFPGISWQGGKEASTEQEVTGETDKATKPFSAALPSNISCPKNKASLGGAQANASVGSSIQGEEEKLNV